MGKKTSTDDFLEFLDEQEETKGPAAFKPPPQKRRSQRRLSPMQKEWLDLALKYAPAPVSRFARSPKAQHLLEDAEAKLAELQGHWTRIKGFVKNADK
jgi:hypothetical protein